MDLNEHIDLNEHTENYIDNNFDIKEVIDVFQDIRDSIVNFNEISIKSVKFIRKINKEVKRDCPTITVNLDYTFEELQQLLSNYLANKFIETQQLETNSNENNLFAYRLSGKYTESIQEMIIKINSEGYADIFKYDFLEDTAKYILDEDMRGIHLYKVIRNNLIRITSQLNRVEPKIGTEVFNSMIEDVDKNSLTQALLSMLIGYRDRRDALIPEEVNPARISIDELRDKFKTLKDVDLNNFA